MLARRRDADKTAWYKYDCNNLIQLQLKIATVQIHPKNVAISITKLWLCKGVEQVGSIKGYVNRKLTDLAGTMLVKSKLIPILLRY